MTGQYDETICYHHINGYHLRSNLQETNNWSNPQVWEEVDFKVFGDHFRKLRPSPQVTHMKLIHNQLPLGERRYRQAPAKDELLRLCSCCKTADESMCHFLQCSDNPCQDQSLLTLGADICNSDYHPVRYLLSAGLEHWYHDRPETFQPAIDGYPQHMHSAIHHSALLSQARIGWYQATKGFLSKR